MRKMKTTWVSAILLACLLVSCGAPEMLPPPQPTALPPTQRATSTLPQPTATSPLPATATATRPTEPIATSQPSLTATLQSTAEGLRLTNGGLVVVIEAPLDGATLTASPVTFKGKAPAGTVISLNNLILVVGSTAAFSAVVELEAGPNLIEFLASDAKGNQVSYFFTVFLEP